MRIVIQIARGNYEAFTKTEPLLFGECFLDTENNKLYIGSEIENEPYVADLSKIKSPVCTGNITIQPPGILCTKKEIADGLYKEWQEFLSWKKSKELNESK